MHQKQKNKKFYEKYPILVGEKNFSILVGEKTKKGYEVFSILVGSKLK